MEKDYVTVYWAPAPFVQEESSWSLLYSEPVNMVSELLKVKSVENKPKNFQSMFGCPAYAEAMKNVFIVKNVLENTIDMSKIVSSLQNPNYPVYFNNLGPLQIKVQREPSITNYTNINYNLGWLFFADEPLEAKFTAPYFPPETPGEGVMLSVGQFDIGSWYRDFNLDYHVPSKTKILTFKEDQPLFYVDFKTDKKIVLKRYKLTKELKNMSEEFVRSRERYGKFSSLQHRYSMSKKSMMPQQILSEIRKNLVE
jgi:hypothetical protein